MHRAKENTLFTSQAVSDTTMLVQQIQSRVTGVEENTYTIAESRHRGTEELCI